REPPSVRSVEPGCGADARIADDRAWIRAVRAVEYCAEPQLRLAQLDAVRCAGDNAVVADHGLHPDTETRLDIGNVIRGMRGRFLREQRQQAATQPIVLAHAGRNEYRELVRVDAERVVQRIRHRIEPGLADTRIRAELAARNDLLTPQHRIVAELAGADEQPAPTREMLEDQWRRCPGAASLDRGAVLRHQDAARLRRRIRAAAMLLIHVEEREQRPPQAVARAAHRIERADALEEGAALRL